MENRKSEILGTLEHWNDGTFEPVPSSPSGKKIGFGSSHLLTFIPYGEILCTVFISYCPSSPIGEEDLTWIITAIVLHPLRGNWMFGFICYWPLSPKGKWIGCVWGSIDLYPLRGNCMSGIYQLLSFIPYGEEDWVWIITSIDLYPLWGNKIHIKLSWAFKQWIINIYLFHMPVRVWG